MPRFARQWWKALDAYSEGDWARVSDALQPIHQRGLATPESLFWRGTALLHLGRYEEALAEFEAIREPLDEFHEDASRHLNHALCLWRLGRRDEVAQLLSRKFSESWPRETLEKARLLASEAGFDLPERAV